VEKLKVTKEELDFQKFKLIKMEKLVSAKWNYKKDEPEKLEKLVNNLKRNGQVENLIVRLLDSGSYEVVNGNHRLEAFKSLKFTKAICYDLGKVSTQEAKRLAIETNETKFEVDSIKLAENIKDIMEQFKLEDLELTMPYSAEDLVNYNQLLEFDWDDFEKENAAQVEEKKESKTVVLEIPNECFDKYIKILNDANAKYKNVSMKIN